MKEDISEILSLDDKGESLAENAAAKLLRNIFADVNMTENKWDMKLRTYANKLKNSNQNPNAKRSSDRSNLNRALVKNRMTWKTLKKALNVLQAEAVDFVLDIEWDDKLVLLIEPPKQITCGMYGRGDDLYMLFNRILQKAEITPMVWHRLAERWLDKPSSGVSKNIPDRSTERGNLRKALLEKNTFTWPTFAKGLDVLSIKSATISIRIKWNRRKKTIHSYTFVPGDEYGTKKSGDA